MNNSFLQIAISTTGSTTLEKALVASCLGGDDNVTKELRELRVRFGELKAGVWDGGEAGNGNRVIRKAGFGIEGEVTPLVRGGLYGMEQTRLHQTELEYQNGAALRMAIRTPLLLNSKCFFDQIGAVSLNMIILQI